MSGASSLAMRRHVEPNVEVLHFSADNKVSGPRSTAVHACVHVHGPSGGTRLQMCLV